jgi:hypothetical protein
MPGKVKVDKNVKDAEQPLEPPKVR